MCESRRYLVNAIKMHDSVITLGTSKRNIPEKFPWPCIVTFSKLVWCSIPCTVNRTMASKQSTENIPQCLRSESLLTRAAVTAWKQMFDRAFAFVRCECVSAVMTNFVCVVCVFFFSSSSAVHSYIQIGLLFMWRLGAHVQSNDSIICFRSYQQRNWVKCEIYDEEKSPHSVGTSQKIIVSRNWPFCVSKLESNDFGEAINNVIYLNFKSIHWAYEGLT